MKKNTLIAPKFLLIVSGIILLVCCITTILITSFAYNEKLQNIEKLKQKKIELLTEIAGSEYKLFLAEQNDPYYIEIYAMEHSGLQYPNAIIIENEKP